MSAAVLSSTSERRGSGAMEDYSSSSLHASELAIALRRHSQQQQQHSLPPSSPRPAWSSPRSHTRTVTPYDIYAFADGTLTSFPSSSASAAAAAGGGGDGGSGGGAEAEAETEAVAAALQEGSSFHRPRPSEVQLPVAAPGPPPVLILDSPPGTPLALPVGSRSPPTLPFPSPLPDKNFESYALQKGVDRKEPMSRHRPVDSFDLAAFLREEDGDKWKLTKYVQLSSLTADFLETVRSYGKTIIEEYFLPPSRKTVLPSDLGGIAGGRKYVVRGILFKVAHDTKIKEGTDGSGQFLYGGSGCSEEFANKMAGHELKGALHYYRVADELSTGEAPSSAESPRFSPPLSPVLSPTPMSPLSRESLLAQREMQQHTQRATPPKFRVPMQVAMDYRGFRLVAMPLLPLAKLVYGSDDLGETVHADRKDLNDSMELAAQRLHLAGHIVKGQLIHAAGDVEGHEGSDGRYYLLDLARGFPPESRAVMSHLPLSGHTVMFRLLRPELLLYLKNKGFPPLSPDAYTLWGLADSHIHNKNVDDATKILANEVIPDLALHLRGLSEEELLQLPHFSREFHRRGVNMRHTGLVRSMVPMVPEYFLLRTLLLVEMVSRTLKNMLRQSLREEGVRQGKHGNAYAHTFRELVISFLNLVTGSHPRTAVFWQGPLVRGLEARFGVIALSHLTPSYSTATGAATSEAPVTSIDERKHLFELTRPHLVRIVKYLTNRVGIKLSSESYKAFQTHEQMRSRASDKRQLRMNFVFTTVDYRELSVVLKYLPHLEFAEGRALLEQATTSERGISRITDPANRLATLALSKFETAAAADPLNGKAFAAAKHVRAMILHAKRRGGSFIHDGMAVSLKERVLSVVAQGEILPSRARGQSVDSPTTPTPSSPPLAEPPLRAAAVSPTPAAAASGVGPRRFAQLRAFFSNPKGPTANGAGEEERSSGA